MYIPNNNYSGEDNVLYKVTDSDWESNTAQITITIYESYDSPIVSDIYVDMIEDEFIAIDFVITNAGASFED